MGLGSQRYDVQQPLETGDDDALLPYGQRLVPRLGLRVRMQSCARCGLAMHPVWLIVDLPMQLQSKHRLLGRSLRHGVRRRLQAALLLRIGYRM